MLRSIVVSTAAVLAGAASWQAQAADQVYSFAYDSADYKVRIAGNLLGSLQADGNTIVVSQMLGVPTFNGASAVVLPFVHQRRA
jgi:hypothetical protein